MAGEWRECVLADVSRVITKGTTPVTYGHSYTVAGVNFVKSESITFDGWIDESKFARIAQSTHDALARSQLDPGDVLFSMAGVYIGKTAVVPRHILPANCNQAVGIIRLDPQQADARFVAFFLRNPAYNQFVNNLVAQSAQPNLNLSEIRRLPISLPPLTEQRAIAHILGTLDDRIELNRRMNETLEAMARALFKSWFVDFDPVRAKLEGRKPAGMDKDTAALFPDSFEDSELGQIPRGWSVKPISDVTFRVTKGDTPRSDAIQSASPGDPLIPMLRVNAITERGEILIDKAEFIPKSIHLGKSRRSILEANDILYTNAGTIGRVAFVEGDLLPANTNQAIAIVRPNPAIVPPAFLFTLMRQPEFQEPLHCNVVHAVQANLALGKISAARAVFPPSKTLARLFEPIGLCVNMICQNRRESRSLAALRDALLPKLLSGELRVSGVGGCTREVSA